MLGLHSGSRAELFRHESGGKGPVDPRLRRVVVRGSGGAHGHVEGHGLPHHQDQVAAVATPRHYCTSATAQHIYQAIAAHHRASVSCRIGYDKTTPLAAAAAAAAEQALALTSEID